MYEEMFEKLLTGQNTKEKMTIRELVDWAMEYIWTQVEISPEEDSLISVPSNGWCQFLIKNLGEKPSLMLYNEKLNIEPVAYTEISEIKDVCMYIIDFIKDTYKISLDEDSEIIVDKTFENHNPLVALAE